MRSPYETASLLLHDARERVARLMQMHIAHSGIPRVSF